MRYRVHPHQASTLRWEALVESYVATMHRYAARNDWPTLSARHAVALLAAYGPDNDHGIGTVLAAATRAVRNNPGRETIRFVTENVLSRIRERVNEQR